MTKGYIFTGIIMLMGLAAAGPVSAMGSQAAEIHTRRDSAGTPIRLHISEGDHYLHRLQILPFVYVSNGPQMAIWCESEAGEYLSALFVTERTARQNWRSAPGDRTAAGEIRRDESLPVWSARRVAAGIPAVASAPAGAKGSSAADAVTSATPSGGFDIHTALPPGFSSVQVFLEINHSTDFNSAYPKQAAAGDPGYSGGAWGSGQPALVYTARVDLAEPDVSRSIPLHILGHSSPDGSSPRIFQDMQGITTARDIISRAVIQVE